MLESENGCIIPRTIAPKPRVSGLHLNATRSFPWKIASELAWTEPTKRPLEEARRPPTASGRAVIVA